MDIDHRLQVLQRQVAHQFNGEVDLYYHEGYGALFVPHGFSLHPNHIIFAFPDNAIKLNNKL